MSVGCKLHRASGFTLVELLVVISIIAILFGILLPVFASARSASLKAVCQSNLKQLYVAFELYAEDWNDTLPCPGGQQGDNSYWAQENGGGIDAYLKSADQGPKSVYCCPAYAGEFETQWSPRTYAMNSFLRQPPDVPYPQSTRYLAGISLSNIFVPSRTILLYEGIPAKRGNPLGEGYVYRCADWQWVRGYASKPYIHWQDAGKPWHGRVNNYLMCDGHVLTMPPEKHPAFTGPKTPENNLWYARKWR